MARINFAVPMILSRLTGADIMTKSLGGGALLSASVVSNGKASVGVTAENGGMVQDMSKSLASFHLSSSATAPSSGAANQTRNRAMDESVDHLFKEGESIAPIEGNLRGAPEAPDKQKTQMMSEFHRAKSGNFFVC